MADTKGDRLYLNRRIQLSLRTLLLIVAVLAAAIGAAKWLGPEVLPLEGAAVGAWLSVKTRGRHLLVWLVPSLWAVCAFGSWHHPGDEYGLFIGSILAAVWLVPFLDYGHLSEIYLLLIAAGALPMTVVGFILDRLPVSRLLWAVVYVVTSIGLFAWGLSEYPSLQAPIAKNGSIAAYAYCAANLGLYVSVLLFLGIGTVMWLWRCFRRTDGTIQSKGG